MIALKNLSLRVGAFTLQNISFEIPEGKHAVLMGPTGSGKTTLLEAICGLRPVQSGQILLRNVDVTQLKPAQRGIGYVPQDSALFASMSVQDNLAFALTIRNSPKHLIAARIQELAGWLQIDHLVHRPIHGLSGGERQRVALGRALAARPSVLCLDEPLSALDDQTRSQMYDLLRAVHQHEPVTILHVTHNHDDADQLATQRLYLQNGQILAPPIPPLTSSK